MKLSQKKTCEGCRAANFSIGSAATKCELGFNNRGPYIKLLGIYRMEPQEPCYKPRTYGHLLEAIRLIKEHDKNAVEQGEGSSLRCAECKAEIDREVDHRIPAEESTSGVKFWLCEVCAVA